MQVRHLYQLLLLIVFLSIQAATLQTLSPSQTFVTQYIVPFDMPVSDLKQASKNQLSRNDFKKNSFSSDNVNIDKLVYTTIYNGTNRIVDPNTTASRHTVMWDSVDVIVTYQAVLYPKLATKRNIKGTTKIPIYVNYTKEIDTSTGQTQLENVKVKIDPSSFKMSYVGNATGKDLKILEEVNNGTGTSKKPTILYLLQTQQFSSEQLMQYFLQNLKSQTLSPTYNSSYVYQFDGLNITFDMTTAKVSDVEGGIANSMKGTIKNYNNAQEEVEREKVMMRNEEGFHTLFSVGFMKNFVDYCLDSYAGWKNYKMDRNRFKRSFFGWRLVDLEYVLAGYETKYQEEYLNDIRVTCNPQSYDKVGIDEVSDKLNLQMTWNCKTNLLGINPSPLLISFEAKLTYLVKFEIDNNNRLSVMLEKTYIESLKFAEEEGIQVIDPKLIKNYAKEFVRNMFGYTIGTYFKVKEGSTRVALKENEGLWIG